MLVLFMKKMGELNEEKTRGLTLKNLLDESPFPDEREICSELGEQVFIKHLFALYHVHKSQNNFALLLSTICAT